MRASQRKSPGNGSQRHAKLGKRPPVSKQDTGASVQDEVKHETFINKSGNRENKTG
jgi:hypothetical protein